MKGKAILFTALLMCITMMSLLSIYYIHKPSDGIAIEVMISMAVGGTFILLQCKGRGRSGEDKE
ncbi:MULTISPECIES: hypothetical protein [Bacillales]|uniref:hypothetical protein n=1 Tax=Bacillales TaxID=1385 RepID=UPI001CFE5233|nr:hypothetical protein [Pseudalkalibacillus hwajinpoensis]WLR58899.1 hypothetical protein LC071_17300 [Pseudalkalibacillus hwajinpoensis]